MSPNNTNELVLYTHPMSRGRTIRWMLEEIGHPYRTELLEYGTTMKAPAFLQINPLGKVPALCHGNTVVTESAAICAYLADAFPKANLAPALNDPLRGAYYRWLFFAAGPLEAGMMNQLLGVTLADEQKKMVGYAPVDEMFTLIQNTLSQSEYLLGEHFSAADIYMSALLDWAIRCDALQKNDTLANYLERIQARPAALRAKQMDDSLIKPS